MIIAEFVGTGERKGAQRHIDITAGSAKVKRSVEKGPM